MEARRGGATVALARGPEVVGVEEVDGTQGESEAGGGGVGIWGAPGWPRCAEKLTLQPPSQVSNWRVALPPHAQILRNSERAAVTRAALVILAGQWPLCPGQQNFCCPQPDWRAGLCNLS